MERDFCITCGRIIPEGRQSCPLCEWASRIRWTDRVIKFDGKCPLCKRTVRNRFGQPENILQSSSKLFCSDCAADGIDLCVGVVG